MEGLGREQMKEVKFEKERAPRWGEKNDIKKSNLKKES